MKLPQLRKFREQGEYPPRGYRVAYPARFSNRDVCYPIGIHWIVMLARWLYHASHYVRLDELDELRLAYKWQSKEIEYLGQQLEKELATKDEIYRDWRTAQNKLNWFRSRIANQARRYGEHRKLVKRMTAYWRWYPVCSVKARLDEGGEAAEHARETLGLMQDCGIFGENHRFQRLHGNGVRFTEDIIGASESFELRCVEEDTPDVVFFVVDLRSFGQRLNQMKYPKMAVFVTREEAKAEIDRNGVGQVLEIFPVSAKGLLARLICKT